MCVPTPPPTHPEIKYFNGWHRQDTTFTNNLDFDVTCPQIRGCNASFLYLQFAVRLICYSLAILNQSNIQRFCIL